MQNLVKKNLPNWMGLFFTQNQTRWQRLVLPGLLVFMIFNPAQADSPACNANQLAAAGALGSLSTFSAGGVLTDGSLISFDNSSSLTNGTISAALPGSVLGASHNSSSSSCDSSYYQSITPDQIFALGSMATRTNGGKIIQPSDYAKFNTGNRRGSGAGDHDFPALNAWSKVDNDFGSRSNAFNQTGFDFDNHNFVFGVDYRVQDNWVAGTGFTYSHNNAVFAGGRGETTSDIYTGMFYTTYNLTDAAHVDATASYGGYDYQTTRNINFGGANSIASASPEGGQYAFSLGAGYDFTHQAFTLAPYLRGDYLNLDIDAYRESGSLYAVRFGKQHVQSMISTLGVQTSYAISFPWGVLIPQLRGEWHHQFLDGPRQVEVSFVNGNAGNSFNLNSGNPSRDYYTFGAEISSVLPGGVSAFLAFETLQGYTTINSNKLMLGGRLEF